MVASTPGGLKLPPFPPRQINQLTMNNPPVSYMSPEQAAQMQGYILNQLDEFDSYVSRQRPIHLSDLITGLHLRSNAYVNSV